LTHFLRESTSGKNLTPVNIITDNRGGLKSAIAYFKSNSNADSRIAVAITGKDEQLVLFDESDNNTAILAAINSDGQLLWQKSFKGVSDPLTLLAPALIRTENKYLFASSKTNANQIALYNVDTAETLACMASSINVESKNVSTSFVKDQTNFSSVNFNAGQFRNAEINSINVVLRSVDDCSFSTCCNDVIDTVASYSICEGDSMKIAPDLVAKKAGLYYKLNKRTDGCDSIALYNVSVIKKPMVLKLPVDSCLTKGDTIVLQATDGFDNYRWLNTPATRSSNFQITQSGMYWVTVTNSCGTKTDSITIDDWCYYPVFMPTAFTPNGDNINDVFRVPTLNKNRLIYLNIYNRFGQLIFHTKDVTKGWNGEIGRVPQQTGTYVYYLEMIDASGKRISQKNTFLLIR
jgi:gliding motility-associated-like protein